MHRAIGRILPRFSAIRRDWALRAWGAVVAVTLCFGCEGSGVTLSDGMQPVRDRGLPSDGPSFRDGAVDGAGDTTAGDTTARDTTAGDAKPPDQSQDIAADTGPKLCLFDTRAAVTTLLS